MCVIFCCWCLQAFSIMIIKRRNIFFFFFAKHQLFRECPWCCGGMNMTRFPHMELRKYGPEWKSCRTPTFFFFPPFAGNQTVNSTVQVRDVAKCNVTHHLWGEQKTCLRSLWHRRQYLRYRIFWQIGLNTNVKTVTPKEKEENTRLSDCAREDLLKQ